MRVTSATAARAATGTAERASLIELAGWLAFAALVVYALLFGGGYIGINDPRWHRLSLSLISLALAGWALLAWRVPGWRPGTAIWPALVAPLASLGLSSLLAPFPRLALEYLAWAVLLVALYLLLVRVLGSEVIRARIGILALVLGFAVGVFYLTLVAILWLEWWGMVGRPAVPPLRPGHVGLPFGGPNIVASVMLLLTVLAYAGLGTSTRGRRTGLGSLSVIAATSVLITASRSAWLALAAGVVVVGGMWVMANRERLMRRVRIGGRQGNLVVGAGAVALLVGSVALGPIVLDRLFNSGDGGRPSYFTAAARMFEDAPVTGLGPGAWAARRIAYLQPGDLDYSVPHAHNIYLQAAAELGAVGLAAGLVAGAAILWLVYRALRSGDGRRRTWAWATLFMLVYMAVVNMADFYANLPGVVLFAIIPLAMLDGLSERGLGLPSALRPVLAGRLATGLLAAGCVGAILVLGWANGSAMTSTAATKAADAGDWERAYGLATDAVAADPTQPAHHLTRALAATHLGDWEAAREGYRRSVKVDDLPQAWLGLALATLETGGPAGEAADYVEAAMRMGGQHPTVAYGAGELYDRLGMTDAADAAWVDALVGLPGLAADPYWTTSPALAERFGDILDRAIERSGGSGWQLALMAGDASRARELAEGAVTGPEAALVEDVIAAWEGSPEALARVEERADADPTSAGLLARAAVLAERAGDGAAAQRYRRMALLTVAHIWAGGRAVRTADTCALGERVPIRAEVHGLWAFRRITPRELTPAGLRCLVFADPVAVAR